MDSIQIFLVNLVIVLLFMTMLWVGSLVKKDASIVDPMWGVGFVLVTWVTFGSASQQDAHDWLLAILVTVWGLRLSGYLLWRNHGKGEDRRYAAMRDKHATSFWWMSFITVFLLQGLILWFVSLPVQAGMQAGMQAGTSSVWWGIVGIGIVVWLIGFSFETIGDYQMAQFKADPESDGKVLNNGVWRYTRHPNYFGDFCVWWGHYLIAAAAGAWWTVLSPALMSILLMKVSGVTLLESDIEDRRPEYREYKRSTNAFFPGPVQK